MVSRFMRLVTLMVAAALAVAVASCGGSGESSDQGMDATPPKVPSVTQFPKVRGRTMTQLAANVQAGPVVAPAGSLLVPGGKRLGFGVFHPPRQQITDAPGAVYVARHQNARAPGAPVARRGAPRVKGR